jgi:hypothetical protein
MFFLTSGVVMASSFDSWHCVFLPKAGAIFANFAVEKMADPLFL